MSSVQIEGYFGGDRAKATPGRVNLTLSGSGMNETLTVDYLGRYCVLLPVRPLEQLAAQVRRTVAQSGKAQELSLVMTGYAPSNRGKLRPGKTIVWFWTDGRFEMLSMEYANFGQISIPYKPVASLLRAARRNLV